MTWTNLFLIKLSPDNIINDTASGYSKYYTIPKSNRFVVPGESEKKNRDWSILGKNSLKQITLRDKLMIVAHGGVDNVATKNYEDLALALYNWGLREVGLITFKCCLVGRSDFLEQFVRYVGPDDTIKIGWVKGYRGPAILNYRLSTGKPHEEIRNDTASGSKSGASRYKIVAGIHAFSVPNSRYIVHEQDDDK